MFLQQCCFGTLAVLGSGYLILWMMAGSVGEAVEGAVESFDGFLEGLHIDIIPDSWFAGADADPGITSVLAAFIAGFGVFGLLASFGELSFLASAGVGFAAGVIIALILGAALRFLHKQVATSVISDHDFIGLSVKAIANIKAGELGQGMIEVKNQRITRGIREVEGKSISHGDQLKVAEISGGVLFVKKLNID